MNPKKDQTLQEDRRGAIRGPLDGKVAVQFDSEPIIGPGQNISEEGVFFIADASLRVRVCVNENQWIDGEVVRTQSMGDGKVGMAIKFC